MILIRGQGLAGTLLGWELERAGLAFAIANRGHENAASVAAAGLINPITGRRLVKSWRVDSLLPAARATYRRIENELGVRVWHEMRVRRLFADERERAVFAQKFARGDLAPFASAADDEGFWIRDAARVDFRTLLNASRAHWQQEGRFVNADAARRSGLVIDCTGRGGVLQSDAFAFVPWESSKGEILALRVAGLAPDVVLNRGHWVVPIDADTAWVGATHEPGVRDAQPTRAAREMLENRARALLGDRPFSVAEHRAGVRVNLPDKHPVAGRHPQHPRLGLNNGLAAKGALWAPFLAQQWVAHLTSGAPFDVEIDVSRFA